MKPNDNLATVAALAVLAVCTVTTAHEAVGHGGACLLSAGHIVRLTSSLFRCSLRAPAIDAGGPASNLAVGTAALIAGRFAAAPRLRLFLLLVTTLSYGWEGGYAVQAMLKQDGDLYFAARDAFGAPQAWWRGAGVAGGLALYAGNIVLAARGLSRQWPQASRARRAARVAGLSAVAGAFFAATAYTGHDPRALHDAVLEILAGALPLLFIPRGKDGKGESQAVTFSPACTAAAVVAFGLFTLVLGRGIGA